MNIFHLEGFFKATTYIPLLNGDDFCRVLKPRAVAKVEAESTE